MTPCRLCGNTTSNQRYSLREMMMGTREQFAYFQCAECECLQIETIPINLADYYPEGYNGFSGPRDRLFVGLKGAFRKARYEASLFPNKGLNRFLKPVLSADQYQLLGQLNLTKTTRILDVGCGTGAYLYPLYELGMTNVHGIDPFAGPIEYPNGYRVEKTFVQEMDGQWDIILFNHSFEHIPNPLESLEAVTRLLAPGGVCIIRIPTVSSFAWHHYRENWFQLDAPRHLFLHSIKSMTLLGEQAGLPLSDIIYDSDRAQFIISEKYKKDIAMYEPLPEPQSFLGRKWRRWAYQRHAKDLNRDKQGDQAAFYFRK